MEARPLLLVVAVAVASSGLTYYLARSEVSPSPASPMKAANTGAPSERLLQRLETLAAALSARLQMPDAPAPQRVIESSSSMDALVLRLDELAARLTDVIQGLETGQPSAQATSPQPKAKDPTLLSELWTRGRQERLSNTADFFAWTPQHVHSRLGRPDFVSWNKESGWLDWSYWGPEEFGNQRYTLDGGAVMFRFEAGMVKEVWP